jgi:hypothetical protein
MRPYRFLSVAAVLLLAGCGGEGGGGGEPPAKADPAVLRSQATEGESVLMQVSALQQAYRADKGRWAATFDELREAGWEEPRGLEFHQPPRIVRARGDELCIVIEPTPANAGLWPQHLDQAGDVKRGPCP